MISSTGENLNVLIYCKHTFVHDWMTFVSYYSIRTYLPDANVAIACERKSLSYDLFKWTKKLNLNFEILKEANPLEYLKYLETDFETELNIIASNTSNINNSAYLSINLSVSVSFNPSNFFLHSISNNFFA